MGKGKQISPETRKLILKLHLENKTVREIGKIIGKSHTSVQNILNLFRNTGDINVLHRSGRPKKLCERVEREILRKIKKNPHETVPSINEDLNKSFGTNVCHQTIRNTLYKAGYHGRVPRRKPLISTKNAIKRLEFAKKYVNKDESFWKSVLYSDESKFNIFGSDGPSKVWRKPNTSCDKKNIKPTVKHGGGNVMVWGCISASGVGELVFIDDKMDKYGYLNILKQNLLKSVDKMGLSRQNFYFQQDNDPKHTSYLVREWLLYNVPHQLGSPPQSPDINPIENVWNLLDKRIRKHNISSTDTLKAAIKEEWNKITANDLKNLVMSMPRRLSCVINAKGYQTKY